MEWSNLVTSTAQRGRSETLPQVRRRRIAAGRGLFTNEPTSAEPSPGLTARPLPQAGEVTAIIGRDFPRGTIRLVVAESVCPVLRSFDLRFRSELCTDKLRHADAEVVVHDQDFASSDQPSVDVDIDGIAGELVERDDATTPKL